MFLCSLSGLTENRNRMGEQLTDTTLLYILICTFAETRNAICELITFFLRSACRVTELSFLLTFLFNGKIWRFSKVTSVIKRHCVIVPSVCVWYLSIWFTPVSDCQFVLFHRWRRENLRWLWRARCHVCEVDLFGWPWVYCEKRARLDIWDHQSHVKWARWGFRQMYHVIANSCIFS